ncbi:MAG: DEAD/DEAH box helicase family protein, partial [Campylobacterota bacterium]|nr:DEAD/DEAH box helicase family protein [Campylobacterota bacterium]
LESDQRGFFTEAYISHKVDSQKQNDIIDKEVKEDESTRENQSGSDVNGASDKPGVSATEQAASNQSSDRGSDTAISNSDRRPDGSGDVRSNSDEIPTRDEGVEQLPTTQNDKHNEPEPANADSVLPKPNDSETYSLAGKAPVELTKGQRRKFNASALEIIKKPLKDITEADREILRHYTGEGGLDEVSENSINQHYTNYATVEAMTNALSSAGVSMNKVLEPAVGSGNFVGFNPDASWDVVDIDKTNIEVTKRLYPQINSFYDETYETFKGKNYDLIISNVPFASEQMLMREHAMTIKPAFKAIHNFYFAHSMDKVKDNGVIAFMTSTGTMDGTTTARVLRKYLMDRGDILGAYRLPEKSQAKNAHTDTMIDIIFIQKRPSGVESRQKDLNNQFVNIGNKDGFAMNEYFIAHPENLLGDTVVVDKDKTKMGKEAWIVRGDPKLENIKLSYEPYKKLKKTKDEQNYFINLDEAREYAKANGLVFKTVDEAKPHSQIGSDSFTFFDKELKFQETDQLAMFGQTLKGDNTNKALHLNRIMTLTEDAINQEDKGLLNTALKEIESYEEIYKKSPHNDLGLKKFMRNNRADVKLKEYMSYFDKDFNPAPIYGERTRFKDSGMLDIDSSSPLMDRALFYANSDSVIDTSKVYQFLSASDIADLEAKGLFVKSGANQIELEFMYYAGNVYKKLDNLENLKATGDISSEAYKEQHKRLSEIIPEAIPFKNIKVKGGESWIPQAVKDKLLRVQKGELAVRSEVFDNKHSHIELYNRYLNKTALAPKKKEESDAENIQRTMEAEQTLSETLMPMVMRYIENNNLSEMLTDEYNRQSNFYVRPEMTGVLLRDLPKSFRGKPFVMQSHQAEGAEKIVFNKKGVLAFAPGGGKTITAVVAVKNLLEQGVMKKPLFVVPVNTIAQWEETIKELYPDASVFEFPKIQSGKNKGNAKEWSQLSREEKEQMAFDLANNRYDFTIIGDTMFQKFGLPRDVLSDYVDDLVTQMVKEEETDSDDTSKKKQKDLVSAEQKRKALKIGLQKAYGGEVEFDFAKLGFDGLIADEVQYYKNIGMQGSDVKGGLGATVSISYYDKSGRSITSKDIKEGAEPHSATLGSMRSYDFRFKSKYVSQHNNGNNVILLTGTPTPNKPLELYTLLQHLDENILKEYGIETSSDFVDTFYDIENYETTDTTGKIVKREGLARMKNLDWLSKILDRFVDYKGFESMPDLPRPKQIDVEHFLKLSKAGEIIFGDVQARLLKAIEDGKLVRSGQELPENIEISLVPMGAGRSASIDLRLYDVGSKGKSRLDPDQLSDMIAHDIATTENNKILKTIELVSNQYKENSNSGQIIFLDRLTIKNPDGSKTSTHQEIRAKILESGLFDEGEVVFVNGSEFVNPTTGKVSKSSVKPEMLNRIMDMYNSGKIKVIIGNTSKLGVGVDLNRKTTDLPA